MGLEQDLADKWTAELFFAFGARADTYILCAEHRGYGTSIFGEEQSLQYLKEE